MIDDPVGHGEARRTLDEPEPGGWFLAALSFSQKGGDSDHDEGCDGESRTGGGERWQVSETTLDDDPCAAPDQTEQEEKSTDEGR